MILRVRPVPSGAELPLSYPVATHEITVPGTGGASLFAGHPVDTFPQPVSVAR